MMKWGNPYFQPRRELMDTSSLIQLFKQINTQTRLGDVDLSDFEPFNRGCITYGTLDELKSNLLFICADQQRSQVHIPGVRLGSPRPLKGESPNLTPVATKKNGQPAHTADKM